jgi:FixJ family two-component response regulator
MTDRQRSTEDAQPLVFVVDDDGPVRKSISRLLTAMGFRSETFASAEEFLARERYEGVGCIVLDVRMPGLTGTDLQDELAKTAYSMPIVFITGHGNIPMGIAAMKKGAVDFLTKPFDDDKLLEAIMKAVEKHGEARKTEVEAADARERVKLLTLRENDVLRRVVQGMLNKQIAYDLGIAEKTVKVHRGRIMEKLRVASVADLVRLAEKGGVEAPDTRERPPVHSLLTEHTDEKASE